MREKVNTYHNTFEEETKKIIGRTNVFLHGDSLSCRLHECNLGNFITDSYVDYVSCMMYENIIYTYHKCPYAQNVRHNYDDFNANKFWTDAPIALLQGGGIRDSISNDVNHGEFFGIT